MLKNKEEKTVSTHEDKKKKLVRLNYGLSVLAALLDTKVLQIGTVIIH